MRYILLALVLLATSVSAQYSLQLVPDKDRYLPGETVVLKTGFTVPEGEQVWDTCLYFIDSRRTQTYITMDGNTLKSTALGMLPPEIRLSPKNWSKDETVSFNLSICNCETGEVLAVAEAIVYIGGKRDVTGLPIVPVLALVQEVDDEPRERYTDYKQFDSRWKNELLNKGPKTIGQIGCAMTSAGNVISWDPSDLNYHLKNNGGYSGNLIIWSKVPGVTYNGSGSISDSIFNNNHVIGDVGGHFVLLTSAAGGGRYYSHDPGKSSNPVYTSSQIYGVRMYRK